MQEIKERLLNMSKGKAGSDGLSNEPRTSNQAGGRKRPASEASLDDSKAQKGPKPSAELNPSLAPGKPPAAARDLGGSAVLGSDSGPNRDGGIPSAAQRSSVRGSAVRPMTDGADRPPKRSKSTPGECSSFHPHDPLRQYILQFLCVARGM